MKVAVLAGGRSSEHQVSRDSAASVAEGLRAAGHEVLWVDLELDGTWRRNGSEIELSGQSVTLGERLELAPRRGFDVDARLAALLLADVLDLTWIEHA